MRAPGYWREETGEELRPAVTRYLLDQPLSSRDLQLIRLYIRQWIDSPVWDENPARDEASRAELDRLRELARVLTNRASIAAWLTLASDAGIDPL